MTLSRVVFSLPWPLKLLVLPFYIPGVLIFAALSTSRFISVSKTGIRSAVSARKKAISGGFHLHIQMFDISLFILISGLDLAFETRGLVFSVGSWRRKLYARHLATIMFELFEDLPQIHGKEFRTSLKSLPEGKAIIDSFDLALKELGTLRREKSALFELIRNTLDAHRDHDPSKQLTILDQIPITEVVPAAGRMITILGHLARAHIKLIDILRRPEVMIKEYFRNHST